MQRRFARSRGAAALLLLTAGALVAPAAGEAGEGASTQFRLAEIGPVATNTGPLGPSSIQLSDERTFTRWAYVDEPAKVRRNPDPNSQVIAKLRTLTHDRTPELVVALEQVVVEHTAWVRVRFKVRPNNQTGWVERSQLGSFNEVNTLLEIQREKLRATLYRGGRRVWSARIGIGRLKWPTPEGRFFVRERLIPIQGNGTYGVFAFGTSATSPALTDWPGGGIIGIHGTNEPNLIPGRISHGCIRVRNDRIVKLRGAMPLGTPILIL